MPIYPDPVGRLVVSNKDQTRKVSVSFPPDMKNGELLDKLTELTDALKKSIADELKREAEAKEKGDKEKTVVEKKEGEKGKIEKMPEQPAETKK